MVCQMCHFNNITPWIRVLLCQISQTYVVDKYLKPNEFDIAFMEQYNNNE